MKQKNLILMVVAVGCGLLAAFLTSQMSAKPAAGPQLKEVWVVAKELPGGTKFTADSIKDQFKKTMINEEAIPEKAVINPELMDGKTLNKTLRVDQFVKEEDLGVYDGIRPPEGKHVVTVRLAVDKMTPFLQPNSRIDLMGTLLTKDSKVKSGILIPNMLVVAVDARAAAPNGEAKGGLDIQMASIAANREEAKAIRACEHANVKLSFILRSDQGAGNSEETKEDKEWSYEKVAAWVNDDNAKTDDKKEEKAETPTEPKPMEATAKMTVPVADITAGTQLTDDIVSTKFKEVPVIGAPPANAILNIKEHVGRFLLKDIAAEQFVPKSYVADKLPVVEVPNNRKAGNDATTPLIKPDQPAPVEVKKLPTFDRTYSTPNGVRIYRYEIPENGGDPVLLGEVTKEGLVPVAANKKDEQQARREN